MSNSSKSITVSVLSILNNFSKGKLASSLVSVEPSLNLFRQASKGTMLFGANASDEAVVHEWVVFGLEMTTNDYKLFLSHVSSLNNHLTLRSCIVGHHITVADLVCFSSIKTSIIWAGKAFNRTSFTHVNRWIKWVESHEEVESALSAATAAAKEEPVTKSDQGSLEIDLDNAQEGKVVTRFPPEPSGYLHIGHAKAALLNEYFARKYNGTLICRFDDTNPSKEKCEFEQAIIEDLALMGIKADKTTYTSDHFDTIYQYAIEMIKKGHAYCDDTPLEKMRDERMKGIASVNRENSIEETLRRFEEMRQGTEFGQKNCLRAKMSVDCDNKAMRDPVMYRCNLLPHHRTGSKYKMYPTYDFACPIVDSIEGVTHALRTNEYRDRNDQYYWFIEKLGIRKPHIWDYSRLNFVYTLLSKRKLTWFVNEGHVTGWDDPRFPTVRGIRRRGMTIEALKQYILMQGASKNVLTMSWDKIWAINKQKIDPIAPRHTALHSENLCKVKVVGEKDLFEVKSLPLHKKNPSIGNKETVYSESIYLDQKDASDLSVGEEVTFMDWGNVIVQKVNKDAGSGIVSDIEITLNLQGDFKKTKKKLTWLANVTDEKYAPSNLVLYDFDYLITKAKLEEEDSLEGIVNPNTEFITKALGDSNMRKQLKKGDIIQLERRGYYIVDKIGADEKQELHLIFIPDGSEKSVGCKAVMNNTSTNTKAPAKQASNKKTTAPAGYDIDTKGINMYSIRPLYNMNETIDCSAINMYQVTPVYDNLKGQEGKQKKQK